MYLDNSSYAVLEFNPFVTPNTLEVLEYYNTTEGNLKAWLSRHPINQSKLSLAEYEYKNQSNLFVDLVIGCNDYAAPDAPGYLTSYTLDSNTGELTYIDVIDTGGFPVPDFGVAAGNTNSSIHHPIIPLIHRISTLRILALWRYCRGSELLRAVSSHF